MRLSVQTKELIRKLVTEFFGASAKVWLFGSRIDDTKRGGDIDLLIETEYTDLKKIMYTEITLLSTLQRQLGDQRIDILLDYPLRKKYSPIFDIARSQGILL
jgi:predicted nucleotidyltransferase